MYIISHVFSTNIIVRESCVSFECSNRGARFREFSEDNRLKKLNRTENNEKKIVNDNNF